MQLRRWLRRVGLLAIAFVWLLPFGSPYRDAHSMTVQSEAGPRQRDSVDVGFAVQKIEPPTPGVPPL
jgi:hypothetical protein